MTRATLEQALASCIDDLRAGRRSVEQCVAQWPEFRDDLRPLLRAAIEVREEPSEPAVPAARSERPGSSSSPPRGRLARVIAGWRALPPAFRRGGLIGAPLATIVLLAFVVTLAGAQSAGASAATLTVFTGSVERAEDGAWERLPDGSTLEEGDRLRTTEMGLAMVSFADGSTISAEARTQVTIERHRVADDGAREIVLEQSGGRLWHDVAGADAENASYVVTTPDGRITVHGAIVESSVDGALTEVIAVEGRVSVDAGDPTGHAAGNAQTALRAGERAQLRAHRLLEVREPVAAFDAPAQLAVLGPFIASLVAPDGRATGMLPDGFAFNQVRGVLSAPANDDGRQTFRILFGESETYTLVLRRTDHGPGEVVIAGAAGEERIALESEASVLRIDLRLDADGEDVPLIEAVSDPLDLPADTPTLERLPIPTLLEDGLLPLRPLVPVGEGDGDSESGRSPTTIPSTTTPAPSVPLDGGLPRRDPALPSMEPPRGPVLEPPSPEEAPLLDGPLGVDGSDRGTRDEAVRPLP